jgi:hypothetical protein
MCTLEPRVRSMNHITRHNRDQVMINPLFYLSYIIFVPHILRAGPATLVIVVNQYGSPLDYAVNLGKAQRCIHSCRSSSMELLDKKSSLHLTDLNRARYRPEDL